MLKINKYIEKNKKIINKRLRELIPKNRDLIQKKLFESANYALHPGGKRLRPILVLATVETLEKDPSDALDIACAIELIHTYSLIHDDLPIIDNSNLRRNKASLHKKYSPWLALLCGNFLLTYAFEIITNSKKLSNFKKNKIISVISKKIGGMGMLAGQYLDIFFENKKIDYKTLSLIHEKKTACLITACLECGAIISEANNNEIHALKNFGEKIGLAFQLVDDMLDKTSNKKILGKPTNIDLKNKKANILNFYNIKKSKEIIKKLYDNGILHLATLPYPPPLLKDLAYKLIYRDY